MATLVLGAVGALIGGPVGFAVGAAVGNRIDQRVLGAKRRGPRLGDLSVQGSSYGAPIPKIFGRMRVAGTVIWSTDLAETRSKRSNGKGQPKTIVYSYSASFAVALSAREVVGIGRIWADGKLLRGEAGDFKTETGFRLHPGGEGQPVDPLIAAAEGAGQTPAYRGLTYAVFEDFQLGDYGNRIPSLTFEVIADEGPVRIGAMLASLSGGTVIDETTGTLAGFAATGDRIRDVAAALAQAVPLSARDQGGALLVSDGPGAARAIDDAAIGAASGEKGGERIRRERGAADEAPLRLAIGYYEVERDFQMGVQTARRVSESRCAVAIDLPAALTAIDAKAIAEARLSALHAARHRATCSLPWRSLDIAPGDRVTIEGETGTWRVRAVAFARGAVELDLEGVGERASPAVADPGRHTPEADLPEGPTSIVLLDLPPLGDDRTSAPQMAVAAAGVSPGWRRAALLSSVDGGISWQDAGRTAAPAIMGVSANVLEPGSPALFDDINTVEIALLNSAMQLSDADGPALLRGSNSALLGDELIQFGRAVPLGGASWRLEHLLRGRRGTEWAMGLHTVGAPFVLLEPEVLATIGPAAISQELRIAASGIGDAEPQTTQRVIAGHACLPLSPVHGRATTLTDSAVTFTWTRRSRAGWVWSDGVEASLAEEFERYWLEVVPVPGSSRAFEVMAPTWTYTATERASDVAAGATSLTLLVRQSGDHGRSPPLSIQIPLL